MRGLIYTETADNTAEAYYRHNGKKDAKKDTVAENDSTECARHVAYFQIDASYVPGRLWDPVPTVREQQSRRNY